MESQCWYNLHFLYGYEFSSFLHKFISPLYSSFENC
jgi:hypothetical protein